MNDLPSAGLHYGIPFETYRQWNAVNIHSLMGMEDSPLHCRYELDHPRESTTEMDVGSAVHIATFEPARLEKEFYFGKEIYDRRTKEGKAISAKEIEQSNGRTYIRKTNDGNTGADSVAGISDGVNRNGATRRFLDMPGQCEVSALWQDPVSGLMCKGRFDKLVQESNSPLHRDIIVELKTCQKGNAHPDRFGRTIQKFNYAEQCAFYSWGVSVLTGKIPLHVFIVAESVAPFACSMGVLDDADMETGKRNFRRWLDEYAACVKSGEWPLSVRVPVPDVVVVSHTRLSKRDTVIVQPSRVG